MNRSRRLMALLWAGAGLWTPNPTSATEQTEELELLVMQILKEEVGRNSGGSLQYRSLTRSERERAIQLRQQNHGRHLLSEHISDLELLGIYARSEEERRDYARQFALRYRALTQAVLRFDMAVSRAQQQLSSGQPLFDSRQWPLPGYRWNLKVNGLADSPDALARVLRSARAGQKSQIRLSGESRQQAVDWVRRSLPLSMVRRGMFEVDWIAESGEFSEGLEVLLPKRGGEQSAESRP